MHISVSTLLLVSLAVLSASRASPLRIKDLGTSCPPGHVSDCRYIVMMHPSYSTSMSDSGDPPVTIASVDEQEQHPTWVKLLSQQQHIHATNPDHIHTPPTPASVGDLTWYSTTMNPETAAILEQQQDAHQIKYLIPDLPVQMYGRVQKEPPSWGLDRIDQRADDLDRLYHYPSSAGQNVTIYVIDTGVNTDHDDFGGRAFHGPIFLPDETDPSDKNGHGTFVAALAAGSTYGVAKKALIVSLKALDDAGAGRLSNVLAAIEWVVKQHLAQGPSTRSIINLSLGAEHNDPTNAAIQEAMRLGVHFAIAAGNDGKDACQFSPASTPGAMTVGATDQDDTIASYSNFGPCVAIYAPGSNIVSAWAGSENARHVQSGTSMASPHVAGLMALWMSENPEQVISVRNMTKRILQSVTKFSLNGKLVTDVVSSPVKLVSSSPSSPSSSPSSPAYGRVLLEEDVEPTPEDSRRLGGLQKIQDFHGKALARNLVFVGGVAPVQNGEIEEEDAPVANGSWTVAPSTGVGLLLMGVWSMISFMI